MITRVWKCKIGPADEKALPSGADAPMRAAVEEAFREITGEWPEAVFSGWDGEFTPSEWDAIVNVPMRGEEGRTWPTIDPLPELEDDEPLAPGYDRMQEFYHDAYLQASEGKGNERHGNGRDFLDQPMQHLISLHGTGFARGQISKKIQEADRLDPEARRRELLGAAVYLAGLALWYEDNQ